MAIIRIAGIDPGLRATGWGVVNYCPQKNEVWASNCGLIRTPEKYKKLDAILYMIEEVRKISRAPHFEDCEKVVVEFPAAFYNPNFSSSNITPVAAISGASMAFFQDSTGKKILPVYPSSWNGGKKKDAIADLVKELIGAPDEWEYDQKPSRDSDLEHITDALGMAYWLAEIDYFNGAASLKVNEWKGNTAKAKKSGLRLKKE